MNIVNRLAVRKKREKNNNICFLPALHLKENHVDTQKQWWGGGGGGGRTQDLGTVCLSTMRRFFFSSPLSLRLYIKRRSSYRSVGWTQWGIEQEKVFPRKIFRSLQPVPFLRQTMNYHLVLMAWRWTALCIKASAPKVYLFIFFPLLLFFFFFFFQDCINSRCYCKYVTT